jgi:hypothetical protein
MKAAQKLGRFVLRKMKCRRQLGFDHRPAALTVRRDADAAAARGGAYDLRRGGIGLRSVRPRTLFRTFWPCSSASRVNTCCAYPKRRAQARICAEVSSAVRPGTKCRRMSSRPRNAVIAPVGRSLSAASATGRPYLSDEPSSQRIVAVAANAALSIQQVLRPRDPRV